MDKPKKPGNHGSKNEHEKRERKPKRYRLLARSSSRGAQRGTRFGDENPNLPNIGPTLLSTVIERRSAFRGHSMGVIERLTDNVGYYVEALSPTLIRTDRSRDAFFKIRSSWSEETIYSKKAYKALALDDDNMVICVISFEPKRSLQNDDLVQMLKVIELQKASKVILGHNKPSKDLLPSEREVTIFKRFRKYGEELNLPVVDQIIMSSSECFSFTANGY
jgi:DNA repair protein RadC